MITSTLTNLDEFFDAVEDITDKNAGGCLFFCYVFWLWLKKKELPTESFQIIQYEDGDEDDRIRHNKRWIKGVEDEPKASTHFTWMYEGFEYDGNRSDVCDDCDFRCELNGLNTSSACVVDEFCIEALNNDQWCSWFNRNDAIDKIYDRLDIDLTHILVDP